MRTLLAAATLLCVASPVEAAPPAAPAPYNPSNPQLVETMRTPSGARSPAQRSFRRKGSFARTPIQGTAPAQVPGTATKPTVGAKTMNTAAGEPGYVDAAALASALAMPENADFRAWYESGAAPAVLPVRNDYALVPFTQWPDDDACIVRHEGSTKFVKPNCEPQVLAVRVAVDRAAGAALEEQFGVQMQPIARVACRPAEGSCDAVESAVRQVMAQHGLSCTNDCIMPDYQWVHDRSVPLVADAARAVIQANFGRTQPTQRQVVEALAGFVQAAIPYRTVNSTDSDLVQDGKQRCGLRTPVATLLAGGDCDSKALLLASMIRAVDPGIGLSLVHCMNGDTPHMILAVGCEAKADEQTIAALPTSAKRGARTQAEPLVLIETTTDWDVGHVAPTVDLVDAELVGLK